MATDTALLVIDMQVGNVGAAYEREGTVWFKGEHVVECYIVKNGIVVARDRIDVPISNTSVKPTAIS